MRQNSITEGSIPKQLLAFFFPIWMGTFFQLLYNTADAAIVGNFLGKEALSAVGGPTATIVNLLVNFFVGLASGATVIIAQHYGAHDAEGTSNAVHTAAALCLAGGAVLTVVGVAASPAILRLMNTPADVLPLAITYIRIYFCGITGNIIYNIGSGVLRAVGDSRRPLYFLIVCSLSNVVLDLLFVVGFGMGVGGAALATILSQAVSAYLVLQALMRTRESYRLELRRIRFHLPLLARILRIGLPAGIQSVMYSVSNMIIQTSVNSFGTNTVAAWTAYGKIDGIFWMTVNSFGIAITTFAGQNFGARQYGRLRKSVRVCMGLAMGVAVLLSGFVLLAGGPLYRLFTSDRDVIAIGLRILFLLVPFYITYVPVEVYSGALRGAGDAVVPMLITTCGICLLRIVWIFGVVPLHHEILFTCVCYPITWAATAVLFFVYYVRGRWLTRCKLRAGHITQEQALAETRG